MTKEEFKKARLGIDLQRTELFEKKCRLEDEYQKQIEAAVDALGLKFGDHVRVTDYKGHVFDAQYNGVRMNRQGYFYLEFNYLEQMDWEILGATFMPAIADINDELTFRVGDKVIDYNTFMGQFV